MPKKPLLYRFLGSVIFSVSDPLVIAWYSVNIIDHVLIDGYFTSLVFCGIKEGKNCDQKG